MVDSTLIKTACTLLNKFWTSFIRSLETTSNVMGTVCGDWECDTTLMSTYQVGFRWGWVCLRWQANLHVQRESSVVKF